MTGMTETTATSTRNATISAPPRVATSVKKKKNFLSEIFEVGE